MRFCILLLSVCVLLLGCISEAQEEAAADVTEEVDNATDAEECICTAEYAPVCGIDGRTYSNVCIAACNDAEVAYQGECKEEEQAGEDTPAEAPDTCSDSDGKDYYVQGTVEAFGKTFVDSCEGEYVKEYYCEEGEAKSKTLECSSGFSCKEGRCRRDKEICSDTDGGNDIYTAGIVYINSTIKATYIDKCTTATMLREYYCEEDALAINNVECETGCKQGRCLE